MRCPGKQFTCPGKQFTFSFVFHFRPSSAVSAAIEVEEGDLIVLASDGLFNNMYKSELMKMLQDFKYTGQAELDEIVKRIAEKTHQYSTDTLYMSPFAKQGSQALSWEFNGGKLDDITVLLAPITSEFSEDPSDPT